MQGAGIQPDPRSRPVLRGRNSRTSGEHWKDQRQFKSDRGIFGQYASDGGLFHISDQPGSGEGKV